MTEVDAIVIWNRAASDRGGPLARVGDRALADLLLAHGMVMNGGIGHFVETLTADEANAAVCGFEYFGANEVGRVLIAARAAAPDGELDESTDEVLTQRYWELVPSDSTLVGLFEHRLTQRTEDFAPASP